MAENGDSPATKRDLAKLKTELKAELLAAFQEAIHDSETRLLTAFYGWAESTRKPLTDLDLSDTAIRQRLASLEGRLLVVEKRLDLPPTP